MFLATLFFTRARYQTPERDAQRPGRRVQELVKRIRSWLRTIYPYSLSEFTVPTRMQMLQLHADCRPDMPRHYSHLSDIREQRSTVHKIHRNHLL